MAPLVLCLLGSASDPAEAGPLPGPTAPPLSPDLALSLAKIEGYRRDVDRVAMVTLGAWSLGNLTVGLVGDLSGDEDDAARYFHQMNWMWGAVNGVISGFGMASAFGGELETDWAKAVSKARTTEIVFLVNGVLDLSYMAVGAWLWERGLRTEEAVLEGYGQSLVMQGAFLFVFDWVLFGVRRGVTGSLEGLPIRLVPTPTGASLVGRF